MLGTDLVEAFRTGNEVAGLDLPDLDITSRDHCLSAIGEFRPEVVINAAALTRVDDCEADRERAFLVNATGAGNLACAAAASGSLLVHYSTDYVFDGRKSEGYVEEDQPNPQNAYGESKLEGEREVRRGAPDHLILRISWLFGRNGPNFIRTILDAARRGVPLRVVNDQTGSPTYTRDVALHTRKMIEAGCRSTYHLTNRGVCTWFELASQALKWAAIRDAAIAPCSSSEYLRPAPRPANSVLVNHRIESEGLPLMRTWEEAAKEYVETCLLQHVEDIR